jgi:choline dehydrogenase-like flavoprotein
VELQSKETHLTTTDDGVELTLTRWRGGSKGPVLVVHGAGVHSGMFALPTQEENFAQFITKRGYDAWLLDWRASTKLPLRQFALDDAAKNDFPAAVKKIREVTGAKTVQAVVHCAGSVAFFMSLAAGYLPDVRCVTASQVALHYRPPVVSKIKSALHVPDVLGDLGVDYLSATENPGHPTFQSMLTAMVDLVHHECDSSVCHRITFLYGHLYEHAQLHPDTHTRLDEQFGKCNITAFRHLAQLLRRGSAARFDHGEEGNRKAYGQDTPPSLLKSENLRIPITFVSGAENRCFLPQSTADTYAWLCDANGPALYKRHVIARYGHIDTFMGSRANQDCYPAFIEQLEACPA